MKKYVLNKDYNSKKLFIGVSILIFIFCTVILIIGTTFAYFSQSDSETTDNIATVDKVYLEYNDKFDENNKFMRQELIPASAENVIKAYTRVDTENKCLDGYGYSACSVYRFSIKNISDISQELQMTLNPTANTFTNLKFLLYEITEEENKQLMETTDLTIDSLAAIPLYESYTLKPNETKIFELVFYVENQTYDQTSEDAGKQFGAGVRVDSITTGIYVAKNFGASCWNYQTTTLTTFNGIDSEGNPKDECSGYVTQDSDGYYTINVPSNVGGQEITTLGNTLFFPADMQTLEYTPLSKVKQYNVEEGITTIADGYDVSLSGNTVYIGTFTSSGYNYFTQRDFVEGGVTINLPNSLTKIGKNAFSFTNLKDITIPSSVESIGEYAFNTMKAKSIKIPGIVNPLGKSSFSKSIIDNLTITGDIYSNVFSLEESSFIESTINILTFEEGVTKIVDGLFLLSTIVDELKLSNTVTTIGISAFYNVSNNNISTLTIPNSVQTIGDYAFFNNSNLTTLTFEENSSLITIGDDAFSYNNISTLKLPNSVRTIGNSAFSYNNISTLTIPNSVITIGDYAFSYNNISTLTIPNSVVTIGEGAFHDNSNLKTLTFEENSSLITIGNFAFNNCDLTYTDSNNPLIIPSSVTAIGKDAFVSRLYGNDEEPENRNLKFVRFNGTLTLGNTDWYNPNVTTLNP